MFKRYLLVAVLMVMGASGPSFAADVVLRDTPCRLYDSRNIGGIGLGVKVSSATIETWGTPGSAQGGESLCGVPYGTAGVVINLTVYQPVSAGYAKVWRYGSTEPLPSSISFAVGQTDESTGLMVGVGIQNGRLSLSSPYGVAHFIVDLAGSINGGGGGSEGFPSPRHLRVLSTTNAPIAGMEPGNRVLILNPTANPFIGHDNQYAVWKGIPSCDPSTAGCWSFETPWDGDLAYVAATGVYWRYQAIGSAGWDSVP